MKKLFWFFYVSIYTFYKKRTYEDELFNTRFYGAILGTFIFLIPFFMIQIFFHVMVSKLYYLLFVFCTTLLLYLNNKNKLTHDRIKFHKNNLRPLISWDFSFWINIFLLLFLLALNIFLTMTLGLVAFQSKCTSSPPLIGV